MLRKTIIAFGAFALGFIVGSVFGFGNGVDYYKETTSNRTVTEVYAENDPAVVDLENYTE